MSTPRTIIKLRVVFVAAICGAVLFSLMIPMLALEDFLWNRGYVSDLINDVFDAFACLVVYRIFTVLSPFGVKDIPENTFYTFLMTGLLGVIIFASFAVVCQCMFTSYARYKRQLA
jgi:hypothetical protein